ncbi:hypothetical protein AVEN_227400-1 [Araneus ventricosus]|uniref:Uncharacterized protein n=1 Tax=Araneus ventricosus TaxID=182803 RepID=A0A4Y2PUB4_ARAVE|nr:hypothetical protein AVEN_227400-1 [Araneus ventricosus]
MPRLGIPRASNCLRLLGSMVGGAVGARILDTFVTNSNPSFNIDTLAQHVRVLIISTPNNKLSKISPLAIEKALKGIGGCPKTVKRLISRDLLIETLSVTQTKSFLLVEKFLDHPVSVTVHRGLNSSRGMVSENELVGSSDTEILEGLSSQGVIGVRRININGLIHHPWLNHDQRLHFTLLTGSNRMIKNVNGCFRIRSSFIEGNVHRLL